MNSKLVSPFITIDLLTENVSGSKIKATTYQVIFGVALLTMLSKLVIPLSFTPVPITGQTLGIYLVSGSYGYKKSLLTVGSYLLLALMGFPLLASSNAGIHIFMGPSGGYLVGFFIASIVIGKFFEQRKMNFFKMVVSFYIGEFIILGFGALGLSFFMNLHDVFMKGILPFLPGDVVKILTATLFLKSMRTILGKTCD